MIYRRPWAQQPQASVDIDWGNPITRGLVFCAVPAGTGMFDLVTRTFGVATGTKEAAAIGRPQNSLTTVSHARTVRNTSNGTTDCFAWPQSDTLRGGAITTDCTIIVLGGQIDRFTNNFYPLAGNTDGIAVGTGWALAIDNNNFAAGVGRVARGGFAGLGASSADQALGTLPENKHHLFGYASSDSGVNGDWFYAGGAENWSGATAQANVTSNATRQAVVGAQSVYASAGGRRENFVTYALIWNRRIAPVEYTSLYARSWQFLAPLPRRLWAPSASPYPTLSAATVTAITATTATPRVTITF
jgi:hypothetical protein